MVIHRRAAYRPVGENSSVPSAGAACPREKSERRNNSWHSVVIGINVNGCPGPSATSPSITRKAVVGREKFRRISTGNPNSGNDRISSAVAEIAGVLRIKSRGPSGPNSNSNCCSRSDIHRNAHAQAARAPARLNVGKDSAAQRDDENRAASAGANHL